MISLSSKTRGPAGVNVGAFGKHPAWDDHVDHLGDQTSVISAFREAFYDQAIGGNIDAGTWDPPAIAPAATTTPLPSALPPAAPAPAAPATAAPTSAVRPFGHVLITGGPTEWIVARVWASKDGRGRTRYPMVACAHVQNTGPDWALAVALPALEALETELLAAVSQEQARAAVAACRQRLADRLADEIRAGRDVRSDQLVGPHAVGRLADRPEMTAPGPVGDPALGWRRTLQQILLELAPYRPGARASAGTLAQHVRVPIAADVAPDRALAEVWSLLMGTVAVGTPVGVVRPLADPWVDAIVGPVTPAVLACLRLGPAKIALSTQVPYELDQPAIDALSAQVLASAPAAKSAAPKLAQPAARIERAWLWIALGLLGLIGIGVWVLMMAN